MNGWDKQMQKERLMLEDYLESLEVGEIIECKDTLGNYDANKAILIHSILSKNGIETDFLYEKDGQRGLWLEVKKARGI